MSLKWEQLIFLVFPVSSWKQFMSALVKVLNWGVNSKDLTISNLRLLNFWRRISSSTVLVWDFTEVALHN